MTTASGAGGREGGPTAPDHPVGFEEDRHRQLQAVPPGPGLGVAERFDVDAQALELVGDRDGHDLGLVAGGDEGRAQVSSSPSGWRRSSPQGSRTPASRRSRAPLSADTGWVIDRLGRAGSSGSGAASPVGGGRRGPGERVDLRVVEGELRGRLGPAAGYRASRRRRESPAITTTDRTTQTRPTWRKLFTRRSSSLDGSPAECRSGAEVTPLWAIRRPGARRLGWPGSPAGVRRRTSRSRSADPAG